MRSSQCWLTFIPTIVFGVIFRYDHLCIVCTTIFLYKIVPLAHLTSDPLGLKIPPIFHRWSRHRSIVTLILQGNDSVYNFAKLFNTNGHGLYCTGEELSNNRWVSLSSPLQASRHGLL